MPPPDSRQNVRPRRLASLAGLLLVVATLFVPSRASAVGLLFVQGGGGDSVDEAQFAFGPSTSGGLAYAQVRAASGSTRFAWVFALPSVPVTVEPLPRAFFQDLDGVAGVRFTMDFGSPGSTGCFGNTTVDSPPPPMTEPVPPDLIEGNPPAKIEETAVFGSDSVNALVARLTTEGWTVSSKVRSALDTQAAQGHAFVLTLQSSEAQTRDLTPVVATLSSLAPIAPLDLFIGGSAARGLTKVTVIDSTQVRPADDAMLRIEDKLLQFDGSDPSTGTNWPTLLGSTVEAADGAAWVIESAGPTNVLLPQATSFDAREFLKSGPYLTRVTTVVSRLDAPDGTRFEAAPADADDVSPEHRIQQGGNMLEVVPVWGPALLLALRRRARHRKCTE